MADCRGFQSVSLNCLYDPTHCTLLHSHQQFMNKVTFYFFLFCERQVKNYMNFW